MSESKKSCPLCGRLPGEVHSPTCSRSSIVGRLRRDVRTAARAYVRAAKHDDKPGMEAALDAREEALEKARSVDAARAARRKGAACSA